MKYLIWSEEHGAWWAAPTVGYTRSIARARRFEFELATAIVTKANQYGMPDGMTFLEVLVSDPFDPDSKVPK